MNMLQSKYLQSYMYLHVYFQCNIEIAFIHFIFSKHLLRFMKHCERQVKIEKLWLDTYPKETQFIDLINGLSFNIDFL